MKIIKATEESLIIESSSGLHINIAETGKGNLRITETGKFIKNLHIIPSSSNSCVISSSREEY